MANYKGQPPKKPYELKARKLFKHRLVIAREEAGFGRQVDAARALGVPSDTYGQWERPNGRAEPNIYWLGRISHVFGIPLDSLIPADKDPPQAPMAAKAKGAGRGRANRPFRAASG